MGKIIRNGIEYAGSIDMTRIVADLFDTTKVYRTGEFVIYNGILYENINGRKPDDFSSGKTYAVGDTVTYNNAYYECITAIITPGAWNVTYWDQITISGGWVAAEWRQTLVCDALNSKLGIEITSAAYDALTPAQKAIGTYWITDGSEGGVVVDSVLNTSSNNPISNAATATAINRINSNLSNLDDVTTIETLAGSTSKYLSSVPKKLVVKIGDGGTQYQVNHLIYTDTLESNRKEYIYIGNGYIMATFVINKTSGEVYVDTLKVNGVDKTSTAQGVLYSA